MPTPLPSPLPGSWYMLPVDDQYYYHAACTVTGEDARFFDPSPSLYPHGDAICSIDCLMPHKNAILQTLFFRNLTDPVHINCNSFRIDGPPISFSCHDILLQKAVGGGLFPGECKANQQDFTTIQAGQAISRVRIWDITWGPNATGIGNDFMVGPNIYNPATPSPDPTFQGTLYARRDPRVSQWLTDRHDFIDSDFSSLGFSEKIEECSFSTDADVGDQQNHINTCRDVYSNAYSTTVVGYAGTIPLLPNDYDRKPSMWQGCQYVYDIADGQPACPLIDDMCRGAGMTGTWRFSLAQASPAERVAKLPSHLCQNFVPIPPSEGIPWISPPQIPHPSNQYLAGFGPDITGIRPTIEPQAYSAYIYRSCALQEYTAQPEYCCANDFADGQGGSTFDPRLDQAPSISPGDNPTGHRTPLIGFNYDDKTPWYRSCFDRNGLTCSPIFRDITSQACGRFMLPHCAIDPQNSDPKSWDITATDGSAECSRWLGRLLFGGGNQWIDFLAAVSNRGSLPTRTGTLLSSSIIDSILANYHKVFNVKNIHDGDMSPLALAMEPVIFSLYWNYDLALHDNDGLASQCSRYTIDDVTHNPMLRRWCGCMLNSTSYGSRYPGVSIACTPTCNSSEVIQYGPPCEGSLCVLDDITISLINSTSGSVSLVQLCKSCGQVYSSDTQHVKQTCDCQIGSIGITAVSSALGNISIREICGLDGNGGTPASQDPTQVEDAPTKIIRSLATVTQTFPYAVLALFTTVVVLAIIAHVISRGDKPGESSHLWRRTLLVSTAIIAGIILIAILYVVIMRSF